MKTIVGGNEYFQKQAPIIAHDNVRKRLAEGGTAGNLGSLKFEAKPQPKEALPILTFDHDVTVHLNGEDIRALHFPSGHTDGDSIIFFPQSSVVPMGDDSVRYGFPFIDLGGGGSVEGMIAACEEVIPKLPADVKVIPGHGAVANVDDVRAYVKMLKDTPCRRSKGRAGGKNARSTQAGEGSGAVEKVERRFREHRHVRRDALQRPDRQAGRETHQAQLSNAANS